MKKSIISWPAKEEPIIKTATLVFLLVISILSSVYAGDDLVWGVFATIVLTIATAPYFVPTTYTINEKGITRKRIFGEKNFLFAQFKTIRHSDYGIWLIKDESPGRYDAFRQLHIPIKDKKIIDEWVELIKTRMNINTNETERNS